MINCGMVFLISVKYHQNEILWGKGKGSGKFVSKRKNKEGPTTSILKLIRFNPFDYMLDLIEFSEIFQ
jgi:hypothetical protein